MKDMRNVMNLAALTNCLEKIGSYQIWGQTEKASAFERKFAREKLKINCDLLKDKTSAEQVVEKYLNFIDFETKTMKGATIQLTHFPSNKDAVINYIHRKQKQIIKKFLDVKNEKHATEDTACLDKLSDIFDLRNCNLIAFNPEDEHNNMEENENVLFEQEREKMINKMKSNPKFFEDLNETLVVKELKIILSQMYSRKTKCWYYYCSIKKAAHY